MFGRTAFVVAALVVLVASTAPALAYLDAGAGSMLPQLLLGGLAGLGVAAKLYWRRVAGFFKGKKPGQEEEPL